MAMERPDYRIMGLFLNGEKRFIAINPEGYVLDDARGYGYKTAMAVHTGFAYKLKMFDYSDMAEKRHYTELPGYSPTKTVKGCFIDERDDRVYKTVKIGKQTWLAENLTFASPDSVLFEEAYGRLYNWEDAMTVAPPGWHLPSVAEWRALFKFCGKAAAYKLKSSVVDDHGWRPGGVGVDSYRFNALPGGMCWSIMVLEKANACGFWWTSDRSEDDTAVNVEFEHFTVDGDEFVINDCYRLFSVRLIKDS